MTICEHLCGEKLSKVSLSGVTDRNGYRRGAATSSAQLSSAQRIAFSHENREVSLNHCASMREVIGWLGGSLLRANETTNVPASKLNSN